MRFTESSYIASEQLTTLCLHLQVQHPGRREGVFTRDDTCQLFCVGRAKFGVKGFRLLNRASR